MTTGFFGGRQVTLIEIPKASGPGLFDAHKALGTGVPPPDDMVIPLMIWNSNYLANVEAMQRVNELFFRVDKSVLCRQLALNIDRSYRWMKYPKKLKEENDLDFLIPYVQRLHGWSDREWRFYRAFIKLDDKQLQLQLHRAFGLEPTELKKLGIKPEKVDVKFKANAPRGYF